ncbi:hypothetical protein F2P44_05960 [Massilia sp. CCM 8695]|uniref:Tail fiber protein n=1 Tax=Massilia frigida TaxID=2609281 RepID=A0ABX0N0M3_9BURK|nr:hypothetical protein [Massilia frigida]NHZ78825.1 hypothetical protein [Massilia frigida]
MTITAIPPLDRTAPTFRADCDTYFATSIPNFTTEINALATDLSGRQDIASKAAINAATSAETATKKAADAAGSASSADTSAVNAATSAANALASAGTIGQAAAFSDANPVVKGSTDPTKQLKIECDMLIPAGSTVTLTAPAVSGTIATLSDLQELMRSMVFYDNGASTAVNYANGGTQRVAPASGAKTLSFTNWPAAGKQAVQFLELVNIGLGGTPAWPAGARFIRNDGVLQPTAGAANINWQGSGTDYVMVSTRDGGTTLIISVQRG